KRSRNSSARASTGLRPPLVVEGDIKRLPGWNRPRVGTTSCGLGRGSALGVESRQRREDPRHALERADVRLAGLGLGDAQHGGGLVVGELLAVAEGQDLAIERVHGIERLLEQQLLLGAGGGPIVLAALLAQEMGGQRNRRGFGQGA